MTERIAEIAAHLDEKPPRTILGSLALENYGNGNGPLATINVELARAVFASAALAEIQLDVQGE